MRYDQNILLLVFLIAVIGCFMAENIQLQPIILLGLALLVFFLERVYIGRAISFADMTVPSFFLLGYILILVLPMAVLFDSIENNAKYLYFGALLITLVVFPLGVWAVNVIVGHRPTIALNYLRITSHDRTFELFYWFFLIIAFVVIVFFFIFSKHVQLIDLIMQSSGNDEMANRFAQADLPKSLQYFFEIVRRMLLPVCMLYAYFMRHFYRGKWRLLFPVTFLGALFVSLLTMDRSPPLGLFAMLAMAYFIANKRTGKLRWYFIIIAVVFAFLLAGIVSIFQYQTETIAFGQVFGTAWYVATYRIFESPITMATHAFKLYNYDTIFLYGKYVRLFSVLPGFTYVESLSNIAPPFAVAPVTFVGDLWRNWGWVGVVGGAFTFGILFQAIQISIFSKLTVVRATVYILLLLGSLAILHGNALGIITLSVIIVGGVLGLFIRQVEYRKNRARALKDRHIFQDHNI